MPNKLKAHPLYKLENGQIVCGTTTILKVLNKPQLLDWAWQCGIKGLDYKAVRDSAGNIGTLTHYLILCHLTGEAPDTWEYTEVEVEKAQNYFNSYLEWEKANPLKPILTETPLVSEQYKYGGTIDCLAQLNNKLVLVDFKTGKGIYPEMFYQLAAYKQLLAENGYEIGEARILRINKVGFEERVILDLSAYWQMFSHCLAIHSLQAEINGGIS